MVLPGGALPLEQLGAGGREGAAELWGASLCTRSCCRRSTTGTLGQAFVQGDRGRSSRVLRVKENVFI